MKKILIVFAVLAVLAGAAAVAARFFTGEDTWLCQDGQWVKHGNPAAAKPESGCGENNQAASSDQPLVGGDRDEHGCIGSAGYSWCEPQNKCLRPWEEVCITGDINFIKEGTAAKNNPGLEKDRLYLIYEEPGKAAQQAILIFDKDSICGDKDQKTYCAALSVNDYGLANGRRIKVTGIRQSNTVLVREVEMQPQQ